ncbi:MAG TPA: hypothetical protein VFR04_08120 [Solirubrobacterales bacterium]|nr:hypothetical protein [Solirubrobacterales bacterium]
MTLGTALAVVVAAIAFVALDPSDDSTVPQDAYNLAIDQNCVRHKKQIAAAQRDALALGGQAGVSRFADSLVPIAGEWRMDLGRATVPIDRSEAVAALDTALLEVEIQAGTLARVAREADGRATLASAARVDAASQQVEAAVEALELERCELLSVEVGSLVQR